MSPARAILVVDLALGDSGKGTIIDFLARRTGAHTVVRFNGGPQAGHNVVTSDGRHHTFAQFGSATFIPGVRTLLSQYMLIEPYALFNEARHLEELGVGDPLQRVLIDSRCVVITPAHQAANRIRELGRGDAAHGTCGMGVGEAVEDELEHPEVILRFEDLADRARVRRKLHSTVELKRQQLATFIQSVQTPANAQSSIQPLLDHSWIEAAVDVYGALSCRVTRMDPNSIDLILRRSGTLLFEGAQGVLLDEWYGFHPHTTWSTTTFANADRLLDDAGFDAERMRMGVLRTYFTRHGAGPFVTEDANLRSCLPEPHNGSTGWQGAFRVGAFDAVAARYAVEIAGKMDWLAITHVDQWPALPRRMCTAYQCAGDFAPIRRLPVKIAPNLLHQQSLTELCGKCRPVFETVPGEGIDPLLSRIAYELDAPIGITSHGPTATEKKVWRGIV